MQAIGVATWRASPGISQRAVPRECEHNSSWPHRIPSWPTKTVQTHGRTEGGDTPLPPVSQILNGAIRVKAWCFQLA